MQITMQPSFLKFDSYFIEELSVKANQNFDFDFESEIRPEDLIVTVDKGHNETTLDDRIFRLEVRLDENHSKYPYVFSITVVGFFRLNKEKEVENGESLLDSNAPAILYSAVRDTIATITGRGPYEAVLLPSVSFYHSIKSPVDEQKLLDDKVERDGTHNNYGGTNSNLPQ